MCGDAQLKPILRIATDADLDRADELASLGDEALPVFRRLVTESGLDMKPVAVEYLFGGEKVVCYFSADERVDFRQLVRDMARELHERIDMRQIGVREEAAIVGGFAHCGQELCCARFGNQFEPVSIRMAKEQDLPLNSTKISGACGRLMCCLRYEFEAYRDFKGRAPKRNAVIETPLGKGKIIEYDTPKEQLTLRLENGKQVKVALADMEASEAAVKKSEDLGCPCRPDTAPRAALERLATPEVQLALTELDREMGLVSEESDASSDIFVEPTRSRRRRRSETVETAASSEETSEAPATSARSRRRRKKRTATDQPAAEAPKQTATRASRRSHPADEQDTSAAEASQAKTTHRRRRHHTSDEAATPSQAKTQVKASAEAPQASDEKPTAPRRSRRRPGDRGGQAAQAQAAQAAAPRQQPRKDKDGAPQEGEASAPKRRRRHRGGRGRGKGGAEGGAPNTTD
jgi:cell fate regulator YaaT (PSP1 superfamily)